MKETIKYLIENPEALFAVKEERACLVGVNSEEVDAILEVYSEKMEDPQLYFWK